MSASLAFFQVLIYIHIDYRMLYKIAVQHMLVGPTQVLLEIYQSTRKVLVSLYVTFVTKVCSIYFLSTTCMNLLNYNRTFHKVELETTQK